MMSFFSKWMKSEEKLSCEPIFSHLRPPVKFLFMIKMVLSEMVCAVKHIKDRKLQGLGFLFQFSETNITLPFSVAIIFKQDQVITGDSVLKGEEKSLVGFFLKAAVRNSHQLQCSLRVNVCLNLCKNGSGIFK